MNLTNLSIISTANETICGTPVVNFSVQYNNYVLINFIMCLSILFYFLMMYKKEKQNDLTAVTIIYALLVSLVMISILMMIIQFSPDHGIIVI